MNKRWTRPGVVFCLASLACCASLAAGEADAPRRQEGQFSLSIGIASRVALGQALRFHLVLTALTDIETPTLDTGTIEYTMERLSPDGGKRVPHGHRLMSSDRAVTQTLPDGSTMTKWVRGTPERVLLKRGQSLTRTLLLHEVMHKFSEPGDYMLTVRYESKLTAEAPLRVVLEYVESVPALIDLIESADTDTRSWARNMLWIVTGQPSWRPGKDDDPQVVQTRIHELRTWWRENHELFERINRIFVPEKPDLPAAAKRDAP